MNPSDKMKVNIHEDLCFCGSGNLIRDCCFAPIITTPPGGKTGYAHPKCYAKALNDCSSKISSEHIISASIFKIFGSNAIEISGASWLAEGESRDISINGFSSNILCNRHNEALSGLDIIAQKFFSLLLGVNKDQWASVIPGYEIERWMLKTMINIWLSGNLIHDGRPFEIGEVPNEFLRILFDSEPLPPGLGLACVTGEEAVAQYNKIMIKTLFHQATGLLGWELYLGFIRLLFFTMGPINSIPRKNDFNRGLIYHPSAIIVKQGEIQREIHLGWPENNAYIVEVSDSSIVVGAE